MTSTFNVLEDLKQIPDYRKGKGKRHALWLVLMLVLLGNLCGYRGYRPLADFTQQHWQVLCAVLELPSQTRLPSSSTFRHVLQWVDFVPFVALFNHCRQTFLPLTEETWVAADGKSIKSTLNNYSESYQNFVSTVSAFTHQRGVVLPLQVAENKQRSALEVVRQVIAALAGQLIVFTLDALHCQKNGRANSSAAATLFDCPQRFDCPQSQSTHPPSNVRVSASNWEPSHGRRNSGYFP